jgi:hypothetical protein
MELHTIFPKTYSSRENIGDARHALLPDYPYPNLFPIAFPETVDRTRRNGNEVGGANGQFWDRVLID